MSTSEDPRFLGALGMTGYHANNAGVSFSENDGWEHGECEQVSLDGLSVGRCSGEVDNPDGPHKFLLHFTFVFVK